MSSIPSDWTLPKLMDFDVIPREPKILLELKNRICRDLIIRPFIDPSFCQVEFMQGAKGAMIFVSDCLANRDFVTLKESGALTKECLQSLDSNMSKFSSLQMSFIDPIEEESVLSHFIHQISVNGKQSVQITFSLISIPGLSVPPAMKRFSLLDSLKNFPMYLLDLESKEATASKNFVRNLQDHPTGPIAHTYSFIRNYTKGCQDNEDSSWTINALNHASVRQLTLTGSSKPQHRIFWEIKRKNRK